MMCRRLRISKIRGRIRMIVNLYDTIEHTRIGTRPLEPVLEEDGGELLVVLLGGAGGGDTLLGLENAIDAAANRPAALFISGLCA